MSATPRLCFAGACLSLICAFAPHSHAAKVVIQIADSDVGLSDPAVRAPVGGNSGTSLGAQRLVVLEEAARIWGSLLESDVEIVIDAAFVPLECEDGAVLGSAGSTRLFRDFDGARYGGTWYHAALADKLARKNLHQGPDIRARFNSLVDTENCLQDSRWYYGLDHRAGSGQLDLLAVALHELAHGLGFGNFLNETTGEFAAETPDAFSHLTLDLDRGLSWSEMNTKERKASALNVRRVVWSGTEVTDASSSFLTPNAPAVSVTPEISGFTGVVDEAEFGRRAPVRPLVALLAAPTPRDGCAPMKNVAGHIVLVERGNCSFVTKAQNAEQSGAAALLVMNDREDSPPGEMLGTGDVSITALHLTQADGKRLEKAMRKEAIWISLGAQKRTYGTDSADRLLLNATIPAVSGSSISHWDKLTQRRLTATNDASHLLMEPTLTPGLHDVDLTLAALRDLGWSGAASPHAVPRPTPAPAPEEVAPVTPTPQPTAAAEPPAPEPASSSAPTPAPQAPAPEAPPEPPPTTGNGSAVAPAPSPSGETLSEATPEIAPVDQAGSSADFEPAAGSPSSEPDDAVGSHGADVSLSGADIATTGGCAIGVTSGASGRQYLVLLGLLTLWRGRLRRRRVRENDHKRLCR